MIYAYKTQDIASSKTLEMQHNYAAFHLGLQNLPKFHLGVSNMQRVICNRSAMIIVLWFFRKNETDCAKTPF